MTQLTRSEMLRRSVVPLVALTGTGGLATALAYGSDSQREVEFATVIASTDSSLTLSRDGGVRLTLPVSVTRASALGQQGNPFQPGEQVVLNLGGDGAILGIEPLSDFVSGVVERQNSTHLMVGGATFVIDDWSLARVPSKAGEGMASIVPLGRVALKPGSEIGVLARRSSRVGSRRIAAVFSEGVAG